MTALIWDEAKQEMRCVEPVIHYTYSQWKRQRELVICIPDELFDAYRPEPAELATIVLKCMRKAFETYMRGVFPAWMVGEAKQ